MNRRIVLYSLVTAVCAIFALVLFRIASGLPAPRVGLTIVTVTALAMSVTSMLLLILTIVVRHKAVRRGAMQDIGEEADIGSDMPDGYDLKSEEEDNAAIFMKKETRKIVE